MSSVNSLVDEITSKICLRSLEIKSKNSDSNLRISATGIESILPVVPAQIEATWRSTENGELIAWGREIGFNETVLYSGHGDKRDGLSVRCLKD